MNISQVFKENLGWRPHEDTVFARINPLSVTVFARVTFLLALAKAVALVAHMRWP
ncbi:hypothetical protein [Desulfosporosinus sp. OT]|uniref:hypothetical protein n=1 Tax=Desulfosporosinus sp. OT TaxID=913865 RepID=UPI0002239AD6|nr:hypothetical protein [Desulfosporosinus sp. OT]EGW41592.1 hypothetical protein DOT_0445 [Desulfosporosinus sp. OT]